MKHYLLIMWGDVEPEVLGPFDSDEARDTKARELRLEIGDANGIFPVCVDKDNGLSVWAYSGGFFEEPVDES